MPRASASCSDVHVADADVPYLAGLLQIAEGPDRLGIRHLPVRRVHLIQVDPLDPQPAKAPLDRLAERSGRPSGFQRPGPGRAKPAFVAMTRPSGYGKSVSAISSSLTCGP